MRHSGLLNGVGPHINGVGQKGYQLELERVIIGFVTKESATHAFVCRKALLYRFFMYPVGNTLALQGEDLVMRLT